MVALRVGVEIGCSIALNVAWGVEVRCSIALHCAFARSDRAWSSLPIAILPESPKQRICCKRPSTAATTSPPLAALASSWTRSSCAPCWPTTGPTKGRGRAWSLKKWSTKLLLLPKIQRMRWKRRFFNFRCHGNINSSACNLQRQ